MDLSPYNDQASAHILELSTELFFFIFDNLPPSSHFDFACTCKRIYQASSNVRKRHQNAYVKYRVTSDLHPATVPTLLRSAFGYSDPISVWHVRSLEIWRDRGNWDDWKPFRFDKTIFDDEDTEPIPWTYFHGEIEDYIQTLETWDDENGRVCEARVQIEKGGDGYLKALLIAKCPRLRDLKFVTDCFHAYYYSMESSFSWFDGFIEKSVLEWQDWFPGLENLQSIAINVFTDTWMDTPQGDSGSQFLNVLHLPRLESLYVRNPASENLVNSGLYLPKSPLKHIFFDEYTWLDVDQVQIMLWQAPEKLVSVAFRMANPEGWTESIQLVDEIAKHHGSTLESLMFYGPSWNDSTGLKAETFAPKYLTGFQKLRNISIDMAEVGHSAYRDDEDPELFEYEEGEQLLSKYFSELFHTAFPASMESLTFWGSFEDNDGVICDPAILGKALLKLLESGHYKNLKAIYLEEVEQDHHNLDLDPWNLAAVIESGKKHNVDIYTARNKGEKIHAIDFPEGIEKWDLATGPWIKPEGLVFNNYLGRRVSTKNESCLDCWRCCESELGRLDVTIEQYREARGPRIKVERKVLDA